jgi:hypothetical protein
MQANLLFYLISTSMLNVQHEGKNSRPPLLHTQSSHKAFPLPPLGKSDHNSILLILAYNKKLKQEAPVTRSMKKWSDEADAKLQASFANIDWNMFYTRFETSNSET